MQPFRPALGSLGRYTTCKTKDLLCARSRLALQTVFSAVQSPAPHRPGGRHPRRHLNTSRNEQKQDHSPVRLNGSSSKSWVGFIRQAQDLHDPLAEHSLEALYERLNLEASKGRLSSVERIIEHLITERKVKPSLRLYECRILVNVHPETGSAAKVGALLEEVERAGFSLDASAYHAVIKVLAVHPDYLLRNDMLQAIRDRWLTLSTDGWHDVVAGLFRERQLELAMEKLEHMQNEGMKVETWLYDAAICLLLDLEEVSAALSIVQHRVAQGDDTTISGNVWFSLLDIGSRCLHHPSTVYAWRKRVETFYLNPSDGLCLNVLHTAAREGDTDLAADVFRVLSNRNFSFAVAHYEALLEAYCVANDVKMALTVLSVMTGAGRPPEDASMIPLLDLLRRGDASAPRRALKILRSLHAEKQPIPTAAVNCIIAAFISQDSLTHALQLYNDLNALCPKGPSVFTFNILLHGCVVAARKDTAMFLASELLALNIAPNAQTYDALVVVSCSDSDPPAFTAAKEVGEEQSKTMDGPAPPSYEDAFRYLAEMQAANYTPRFATYEALVKRCTMARDVRAWSLVEEAKEKGYHAWDLARWMRETWKVDEQRVDGGTT
ncbi:MAG: hypothetical protein M1833_000198 [Piccolia ochrophora]|nr:MAG: hypothetical protein M1833_000198 [Piccolia ochrophora]